MLYRNLLLPVFLLLSAVPSANAQSDADCQPVGAIPAVIAEPGRYCLDQSATWRERTGTAITITADNVVLDLQGSLLKGVFQSCSAPKLSSDADGIVAHGFNVSVKNGVVTGFRRGVSIYGPDSEVSDMKISQVRIAGIAVNSGNTGNAMIATNTVSGAGGDQCTSIAAGIHVVHSNRTYIHDNAVYNVTTRGDRSAGIFVQGSGDAVIRDNHLSDAGRTGIDVNVSSIIDHNVVRGHSGTRIAAINCSTTQYQRLPVVQWGGNTIGGYVNPVVAAPICDYDDRGLNEILN